MRGLLANQGVPRFADSLRSNSITVVENPDGSGFADAVRIVTETLAQLRADDVGAGEHELALAVGAEQGSVLN
jgi:hypothetical protein